MVREGMRTQMISDLKLLQGLDDFAISVGTA